MYSFYGGRPGNSFVIRKTYNEYNDLANEFKQVDCPVHYGEYGMVSGSATDGKAGNVYRRIAYINNDTDNTELVGCFLGPAGAKGKDGESAYQIASHYGTWESEQAWLESLKGESAYQIASHYGTWESEQAWLESLNGVDGVDGADGADGVDGNDGAKGDTGAKGDSFKSVEFFEGTVITKFFDDDENRLAPALRLSNGTDQLEIDAATLTQTSAQSESPSYAEVGKQILAYRYTYTKDEETKTTLLKKLIQPQGITEVLINQGQAGIIFTFSRPYSGTSITQSIHLRQILPGGITTIKEGGETTTVESTTTTQINEWFGIGRVNSRVLTFYIPFSVPISTLVAKVKAVCVQEGSSLKTKIIYTPKNTDIDPYTFNETEINTSSCEITDQGIFVSINLNQNIPNLTNDLGGIVSIDYLQLQFLDSKQAEADESSSNG